MNPQARKRLFVSFIILILVCFGLYLYFDNSQAVATAQTAQLKTNTYDVGTTYSGQITKQYVQEGDTVKAGDKLFEIDSAELKVSLQKSDVSRASLGIPLTKDNDILVEATKAGSVKTIDQSQGSFVPANTVLATISQTSNLQVEASVNLSPDQYSHINHNSRLIVTLPDGTVTNTPIGNTDIVNENNQVIAKLTGDLHNVKQDPLTIKDGAPVKTKLQIVKPLWQRMTDAVVKFVRSIFP